jgi:hypothetical protein
LRKLEEIILRSGERDFPREQKLCQESRSFNFAAQLKQTKNDTRNLRLDDPVSPSFHAKWFPCNNEPNPESRRQLMKPRRFILPPSCARANLSFSSGAIVK